MRMSSRVAVEAVRRTCLWGSAAVIILGATACFGSAAPKGRPAHGVIEKTATQYAQAKLAVGAVFILRVRHPTGPDVGDSSCAIVEIRTPEGETRRVIVVNDGDPPAWEGIAVSEKFGWDDFRPDSDVDCGLYNAGIHRGVS